MKTIAFVSSKGGVGKTTLVYHLAHMLPRIGYPTLAVDLDPQAALSSMFFEETQLEASWERGRGTVFSCVAPLLRGSGEIALPEPTPLSDSLWGLAGDPALWNLEGVLANAWVNAHRGDRLALKALSSFAQIVRMAGASTKSEVALLDLGAGLGALNRTALLAADFLVLPLAVDTLSLLGLRVLGPTLREWRQEWRQLRESAQELQTDVPEGSMSPVGYIMVRTNFYGGRPHRSHAQVLGRVPSSYAEDVLGESSMVRSVDEDPNCLSLLRNYYSLMSMAWDARKPMFDLSPSTGAMGSYTQLVHQCRDDFEALALRLAERCGLTKPSFDS